MNEKMTLSTFATSLETLYMAAFENVNGMADSQRVSVILASALAESLVNTAICGLDIEMDDPDGKAYDVKKKAICDAIVNGFIEECFDKSIARYRDTNREKIEEARENGGGTSLAEVAVKLISLVREQERTKH